MTKKIYTFAVEFIQHWLQKSVSVHAAAGAYFSIFALVPLIVAVLFVSNMLLDSAVLKNYLILAGSSISPDITQLIVVSTENFSYSSIYTALPIFGFFFFLWVIVYTFALLINGIHHITDVENEGFKGWLLSSVRSVIFFVILLLFLVTMVVFDIITSEFFGYRELYGFINQLFNISLTVLFLTVAYAVLSVKPLSGKDRFAGAVFATLLFTSLQYFVTWWLQSTPATEYFGATGIIVGLLVVLYLSYSIFYAGITFAYILSKRK